MFGRRRAVTVVVATKRAVEVVRHLESPSVRVREALTTEGVLGALGEACLVILDDDLAETDAVTRRGLLDALEKAGVPAISPGDFLRDPAAHLARLERRARRGFAPLTPLRVAFVSLSGGTGCTTLAWELARYAAEDRRATVALVELTWGRGALTARLGLNGDAPDLYQVASGLGEPALHTGVSVVPVGGHAVRLLLGNPDRVRETLEALARRHLLLVVDAHAGHPLWPPARETVDRILVVTDPRSDAVENARRRNPLTPTGWTACPGRG